MRPLINFSFATKKAKPKRKAKKKAPARKKAASKLSFSKRFDKWLKGRKRTLKYWRQNLAPYAIVLGFAFVCLVLTALWASGVFGQLKEELNHLSGKVFANTGFSIQHVTVEGRDYTDRDALNQVVGAIRGQSLMHFDVTGARERVEQLEWVDEASVVRLWPDALHIVLVEARPAAIWQRDKKLSLIDRSGRVISSKHLSDFAGLPHVVGEGANKKAAQLSELLAQYPLIKSRVSAAVRVGNRRWNLRLDTGVDIQLPDQNEGRALERLLVLEEEHRLFARDIRIIDLRDPERLYVRLNSDQVLKFDGSGLDT